MVFVQLIARLAALATTTALFAGFAAAGQGVPITTGEGGRQSHGAATASATGEPLPRGRLEPGYLSRGLPDSSVVSPPPPSAGSPAEARDRDSAEQGIALRGTPRWRLAIQDADIFKAGAPAAFSCTVGVPIGPQTTPQLDRLLKKALADLANSTAAIKERYSRPRPFMVNGQPTCTPESEQSLRGNGSYPSGHAAIGFGWGLILAELVPDRAARIVARGRAFGDSRRICNVHWLSDVEEGRIAAATTVARLHGDPAFRDDMDAARQELRAAKGTVAGCEAEAKALAG